MHDYLTPPAKNNKPTTLSDGSYIRPWREPHIVSAVMLYCPCVAVWAPDMTHSMLFPFIIKFPSRFCSTHARDYYRA